MIGDEDLDRADEHQHEAGHDAVEDDVARQVDGHHAFMGDDRHVAPHQPAGIGKEADPYEIDEDRHRPRQRPREIVIEHIDLDVP
ncbi:hypothetical protein ABIE76_000790 [Sinorhizobium fredii]